MNNLLCTPWSNEYSRLRDQKTNSVIYIRHVIKVTY